MTEANNAQAIADLDALGIDTPQDRWLAARDILEEHRAIGREKLAELFLVTHFYDLAETNALRRGEIDAGAWGIKLIPVDYYTARFQVLAQYTGKQRERVSALINDQIPERMRSQRAGA